jgi:hypothetical protein
VRYEEIDLSTVADYVPDPWWWFADGVGVDFTACTARLSLRVVPTDPAPLIAISTTPSSSGSIVLGTPLGGNAGLVQILISKTALAPLVVPVLHGELVITFADGSEYEFVHIDAFVRQGSTY